MPKETEGRIPLADLLMFHQLARSLTSSFDLDTILRTILEHMERMVDAELWTLLMLDEGKHELYYAVAAGQAQEALRGLRAPFATVLSLPWPSVNQVMIRLVSESLVLRRRMAVEVSKEFRI